MKKFLSHLHIKNEDKPHPVSCLPVAYALELHRVIEMQAYLRAEQDGFRCPPLEYWLAAENEVHQCF